MAMGRERLLPSIPDGMAPAAALRFRTRRLCVLVGLRAGVGESTSSKEFTLDSEVVEGLGPIEDAGSTSGGPSGGVVTRRMLARPFGDDVGVGFSDFDDEGDENFNDGRPERELEKSASGTARGCLGMRSEVPSVEARGRTPISVRGSTTGSDSCSDMEWGMDSFLGSVVSSSSDSCRPFPLSTLLHRLLFDQRSLKLKYESLRFRPELRVLCLRSLSDICTSVSAS
jgi:hypothetical protein